MIKYGFISAMVALASSTALAQSISVPTQAQRARDFANSIGANMHLNSEWDTAYSDAANGGTGTVGTNAATGAVTVGWTTTNVSKLVGALSYTGISHGRVSLAAPYIRDRVLAIAMAIPSFKVDDQVDTSTTIAAQIDLAQSLNGRVETFEGMNEATTRASYEGLQGAAADCQFQTELRNAVNGYNSANKTKVPLLAPSVGGDSNGFSALAACASQSTASNGHFYSDYGPPTAQLLYDIPGTNQDAPAGAPIYSTESGPITNPETNRGMSEDAAAKVTLAATLGFYANGVQRDYLYEAVDENPQSPQLNDNGNWTETEMHYGMFHNDWSPKYAAQMLHAQARIMADYSSSAATFTPAKLAFGLSGLPSTAHSLLLQKGTGIYVLALWNESPQMWVPATNNSWGWEQATPASTVTVSFAAPTSLRLYDPFDASTIDAAGWATPIKRLASTTATQVTLTDHPVYMLLLQ